MELQSFQKLISTFPCLVPLDTGMSAYVGFIRIAGREFGVSITSDCSRFDAEEDLKRILEPHIALIQDRLKSAVDAHEFLVELRDVTERATAKACDAEEVSQEDLPPAVFYERLLNELSTIGWEFVSSMGQTMRVLELKVIDSASRYHIIGLTLPTDYPFHPPHCMTSLPRPFQLHWNKDKTLSTVLQQFRRCVESYQDFFRVMEDVDKWTWVLEPQHPTWRDTYRRIALGKHCSVRIEIDPRSPVKGFPECRFLGSEAAISPFKQRLNQNMHMWDALGDTLPRENIERILETEFPPREDQNGANEADLSNECGICYAYRLEDRAPDITCDLPECSKAYHRTCLLDWLRVLPDTRESFGAVTGKCVYCDHSISLSVKEK